MEKLVSILIPAYNAEKWINETITSALSQTWPNCELIVVDDGSSDNTFNIANQFASKSVKVIRQENMGACAARNKALSYAQGDYIQWLDADDLLAEDKVAQQMRNTDRDASILLSSAFAPFSFRRHRARFVPTSLWQDLAPVEWLIRKFTENVWMNPAVWLVSRKLTEMGGPWDERLSLDDDGEYFSRVVAASDKIEFVPEAMTYYRQVNVHSISNTLTHKSAQSLLLSIELCIYDLLSLESSDRTKAAALKYLQHKLIYFYPDEKECLEKVYKMAKRLGGTLSGASIKKQVSADQDIDRLVSNTETGFCCAQIKEKSLRKIRRIYVEFCQVRREMTKKSTAATSLATVPQDNDHLAYILITPARNEAAYIKLTLESMARQTVPPIKWVIVSDGSTDGTDELVKKYAAKHKWIELVRMPERKERNFAGKVHAFNVGYAKVKNLKHDIVGNLDADISFEQDHFKFILGKFAEHPSLGVAGTAFIENSAVAYNYDVVNIEHVSGQCQLFRRECFNDIGGYRPIRGGGIDWVAVTTARMRGWKTRTYPEKAFVHHRRMGTGKGTVLGSKFRFGKQDYYLGGHPLWEVFRSFYQMKNRPYVLGGLFLLSGYVWGFLSRVERPIPAELVAFRRKEQMQRLKKLFRL